MNITEFCLNTGKIARKFLQSMQRKKHITNCDKLGFDMKQSCRNSSYCPKHSPRETDETETEAIPPLTQSDNHMLRHFTLQS